MISRSITVIVASNAATERSATILSLTRVLLSGCGFKFSIFFFGRQRYKLCSSATHALYIQLLVTQHYVTPLMPRNQNQTWNRRVTVLMYCRFSHDVTKIQITKLLILLIFYFNEV